MSYQKIQSVAAPYSDVIWHHATVTRSRREAMNCHKGGIIWFTGLSGAGKSTLAHAVEEVLYHKGCRTFVLDGDNIRHGLCADLGFSDADREENIRRIGEVAKLFMQAGIIVLTAFISPFRADRARVRNMVATREFIEVYCRASLSVCENRDVKGLYKKARQGEIAEFTGVSSPYEVPENPELIANTGQDSLETCVQQVIDAIGRYDLVQ